MKTVLVIIGSALTLFGQVIPFEGTEWGIRYLNAHPGSFKLLPLAIGIVSSLFFTCTITPIKNAQYGLIVGQSEGRPTFNPFWLWLIVCVAITVAINLMLE